MKTFLLVVILALCLTGCDGPDENSITLLREYNVDDLHTIVGVGSWTNDGQFRIESYDGQVWNIPQSVEILEGPVSLESFKRVTK